MAKDPLQPAKAPLEKSGEKLAASAEKLKQSSERIEDSADRRTELSADRTVFAAERTYAAWVRTGLFSLASGVGSKKLLADLLPNWLIIAMGSVLLLFSAFCFGAAIWRDLNAGAPPPQPDAGRLPSPVLVAINSLLILIVAAALLGFWLAGGGSG